MILSLSSPRVTHTVFPGSLIALFLMYVIIQYNFLWMNILSCQCGSSPSFADRKLLVIVLIVAIAKLFKDNSVEIACIWGMPVCISKFQYLLMLSLLMLWICQTFQIRYISLSNVFYLYIHLCLSVPLDDETTISISCLYIWSCWALSISFDDMHLFLSFNQLFWHPVPMHIYLRLWSCICSSQ